MPIKQWGSLDTNGDKDQVTNPADNLEPDEKRKLFLHSPSPSKHEQQTNRQDQVASAIHRSREIGIVRDPTLIARQSRATRATIAINSAIENDGSLTASTL